MVLMLFYVGEDARVWAHWNYSLDVHFSYWGPVCCFSPTWVSLGVHHWGDCSGWCLDYRQHLLFTGMADNTFFFFFVRTDVWPIRVATEIWGDIYCGATGKYIFFFPWWELSLRYKGFLPRLHVLFCLWMNLWCSVGAICVHESTRIQAGRAGGRSLRSDDTAEWRPATELQSDSYLSLQLSFFRPRIQRGHD